jgi:tetratricopeptide (TPR) repeat protein
MPGRPPRRVRRWQAAGIVSVVLVAVAGAAGAGWWYARESPPHQGPIVLISIDGVPASEMPAYGAQRTDMPAIAALAADSVVFDRAYGHSPQMLPAHASILSGLLPIDHGVRDDAGYVLDPELRTLAELLRSRGFATGAAVSSFLLRRESGVGQGFAFFDGEMPAGAPAEAPAIDRPGAVTIEAAERWMEQQDGQRFFLFVQVGEPYADLAVTRLTQRLKEQDLYDPATIVFVGDRGDAGSGTSLDETTLRVPLFVKQPNGEGAGRHVPDAVQHVDVLPTMLDLVRAPVPDDLRGRSLRDVLDDRDAAIGARPIYSESLTAYFRFGGDPIHAVTEGGYRLIRGAGDELVAIAPAADDAAAGELGAAARLRTALDDLLEDVAIDPPAPIRAGDEERMALAGYLANLRVPRAAATTLNLESQDAIVEEHRAAVTLIGQKKYSAGIRALQDIARRHGALAPLHFQIGSLLAQTGRFEEAIAAFRTAQELRPDAGDIALGLAGALLRTGQAEAAQLQTDRAVALAGQSDARARAAAHEMAARVALARGDADAAIVHAEAAQEADPGLPVTRFVRGRLEYDEGKYEEAAAAFEAAAAVVDESGRALADLHFYYGETLAQLDRYDDAEAQFRRELEAFPRNIQAYTSLAMLYRASNRDGLVEDVLNELVAATPTPEGYAVAARLWTVLGDRSRAEALRSDARARFSGDPSLATLLGRDGRR